MTKDNIIRMAREQRTDAEKTFNAIKDGSMDFDDFWYGWLDNWRNMVFGEGYQYGAAAEREEMAINSIHSCHDKCQRPICVAIRKAVEAEREACAKLCDSFYESWIGIHGRYEFLGEGAQECAYAIRARRQE